MLATAAMAATAVGEVRAARAGTTHVTVAVGTATAAMAVMVDAMAVTVAMGATAAKGRSRA